MQYHMRDYVQALKVLYNGLRVIWGPRVVSSATRGTIKALKVSFNGLWAVVRGPRAVILVNKSILNDLPDKS